MRHFVFALIISSVLFTACSDAKENKNETTFSIEKVWEISEVSQPESVLTIPGSDWIYVSNVNGEETGFISRISKSGMIDQLKWVDGINTPTGMDYYKGNIYVADQTQIHVIDIKSGKIIKTLPSEAKGLNDISISKDGQVFVSDLTGASIYTVEGDELVVWLKSDKFPTPNGLLVQDNNLIVGYVGDILSRELKPDQVGSMFKVSLLDKSIAMIKPAKRMGSIDGIVPFRKGVVVSDPMAGKLFYVTDEKKELISNAGGVADVGIDDMAPILYAPYIFENKLVAYKVVEEKWDRITTKAEYLEKCAGNYYGEKIGKSVASKDGIISGNFGGKDLKGTWEWKGEYFARTSTLGDMDLGYDEILIEVSPSKMKLTLQKGTGISVVYDKL